MLTLTGVATLDDYEVALRQIHYSNDSNNPDTVDRLVEVVVNDGVNTSNVAAAVIGVVPGERPTDPRPRTVRRLCRERDAHWSALPATPLSPASTIPTPPRRSCASPTAQIPGDGDTLTVGQYHQRHGQQA